MTECERLSAPMVDREALARNGWTTFMFSSEHGLAEQLIPIASSFGVPVATRAHSAIVDVLKPTARVFAQPRSLSALHSAGEFPLHTDTAHWIRPCRYIMLGCVSPGGAGRKTLLLDTNRLQLTSDEGSLLRRAPFRVVNGRTSFFSTIYARDRPFVRLDPGCMQPVFADGARALALRSARKWESSIESIDWDAGKVLLVDNWRVLHGRGPAAIDDGDRTLLRISIG